MFSIANHFALQVDATSLHHPDYTQESGPNADWEQKAKYMEPPKA